MGSVGTFLAGRLHPPVERERGIGEKKERNVNAFSLLYSFSSFASTARRSYPATHSRRSLQFSSFRKVSHPRVTLSFHFHHPYVVDFGAVSFSFHFPEPCFLFFCFLKLHFLSTLVLFFHLLFLFMASVCGPIPVLSSYFNFFHFNSYLSLL